MPLGCLGLSSSKFPGPRRPPSNCYVPCGSRHCASETCRKKRCVRGQTCCGGEPWHSMGMQTSNQPLFAGLDCIGGLDVRKGDARAGQVHDSRCVGTPVKGLCLQTGWSVKLVALSVSVVASRSTTHASSARSPRSGTLICRSICAGAPLNIGSSF